MVLFVHIDKNCQENTRYDEENTKEGDENQFGKGTARLNCKQDKMNALAKHSVSLSGLPTYRCAPRLA